MKYLPRLGTSFDEGLFILFCGFFFQILTIAVLAIVVTAPIGAIAIHVSGPKLLQKAEKTVLEELSPEPSTNNTTVDKHMLDQQAEHYNNREGKSDKPSCPQHCSEEHEWNNAVSDGSPRDVECTTAV